MKILVQIAFLFLMNACFLVHTFSSFHVESLQRRAITPFHNSGNGNDHGKSPVPNRQDQIFHPVNSRVIRLQEPVERPPELPNGHPIEPHQPLQRPTQEERSRLIQSVTGRRGGLGRNVDNGKGKAKVEDDQRDQKKSKKRKASEINNDHEAGISRAAPTPPPTSTRTRHRSSRPLKSRGGGLAKSIGGTLAGAIKVANAGYRLTTRTYGRIKETCNYACQRAREGARNVQRRIRGSTPPPPPTVPLERYYHSDSSDVGVVGHDGHLRGWAPARFDNQVTPSSVQEMQHTIEHRRDPLIDPDWVLRDPYSSSSSSSSGYSSSSSENKSSFLAKQHRLHPAFSDRFRPMDMNHPPLNPSSSSNSANNRSTSSPADRRRRRIARYREEEKRNRRL